MAESMFFTDPTYVEHLKDAAKESEGWGLGVFLDVRLERLPRQRCTYCGKRRVCFVLSVEDIDAKLQGRPVCAEHAGIR